MSSVSQQYNPIHCPVYGASFCNTATLAILLSSHYFWQCKWLIPLKTALCGEQNPGIIWVKSLAFRLQPCSFGSRSPSLRTSQSRGEISHPHLMTVIFGDLLWINANLQQFFHVTDAIHKQISNNSRGNENVRPVVAPIALFSWNTSYVGCTYNLKLN